MWEVVGNACLSSIIFKELALPPKTVSTPIEFRASKGINDGGIHVVIIGFLAYKYLVFKQQKDGLLAKSMKIESTVVQTRLIRPG